tara:strand:- start:6904 stop:9327 length:2424 start_codon:yes stop_codon:yes gene_type:complete
MKLNIKNKGIFKYIGAVLALIFTFWLITVYELYGAQTSVSETPFTTSLSYKFINDFWCAFIIGLCCLPIYYALSVISKKLGFTAIYISFSFLVILQFSLVKYSKTTLINLGADILGYSIADIFSTVTISESISVTYFFPFLIFPILFILIHLLIKTYANKRITAIIGVSFLLVFATLKLSLSQISEDKYQNKTTYLVKDIVKFIGEKNKISALNFEDRNDFPLLKPLALSHDVLSSFIAAGQDKPNIVVIVVEGLGSEFMDGNTYSGYTPYLDELALKSLNWKNFVSTTGRSFGVLPAIFGSLPFGEKGFLELTDTPSHLSLISILKFNDYHTSYYSGGASSFDRKVNFLEYNGIDNLIDDNSYGANYTKTESNSGGFSWGYPDSEIFKKALTAMPVEKQPRLDIVMTLSNHEPFQFPGKENYMEKVDKMLEDSEKPEALKNEIYNHRDIFGSLLYTDDAIKGFMDAYAKRPDYNNTIFLITGDHRLIPMTQKDKLCRFHVPFLLFSPMLKKVESFKSVSSHWDITPSLLRYLMNNHKFKPIKEVAWMGKGLDTVKTFRNTHTIPLMRYKGSISDIMYKEYLFSNDELFKVNENFGTYKITDEVLLKEISDSLVAFKEINAYVTLQNKIFPDSLNMYVVPKIKFSEEQLAIINTYHKDNNFDVLLLKAKDLAFNKEYKISQLLCEYILNEYPNYTDARILKGRTLAWEKHYESSEISLLNALQRSPYYDDVYLAILDMYWWSEQEEKSIAIYNTAIKNKITNSEISFKMAKAYQRMGHTDFAQKLIDSIVKIQPENSNYLTFKESLK